MTKMTTTEAAAIMAEAHRETEADADYGTEAETGYIGPVCQVCGGPCRQWKGSVHGYTCQKCLDAYLAEGAARWEAKPAKVREKIARNLRQSNDTRTSGVTANGQRRDGAAELCAAPRSGVGPDAPPITARKDRP
jgi:hypothetical protein